MASVGEGARFPAEAEPEVPDPGAEPEAGFDKTFCVPEQPAKATAVHRSMTAIKEVFRCISERASLSYMRVALTGFGEIHFLPDFLFFLGNEGGNTLFFRRFVNILRGRMYLCLTLQRGS